MQTSQKFLSRLWVDYKPAELKIGVNWYVTFYCKNPITNKLERFRYRVPTVKSIMERKKVAKTMLDNINKQLHSGWSPYLDANNYSYKKITDTTAEFIRNIEKEIKDGIKRADTLRTYKSFLKNFNDYNKEYTFILELKKVFMVRYLEYLYNERKNSPRTYNNVLKFFTTFFNWCIEQGYLQDNPTKGIAVKKKTQKTRTLFDENKEIIFNHLQSLQSGYNCLCMCTYFCFIRRTELTKLKVKDIDINKNVIYISGDISKNGKSEVVTIPETLKNILLQHIENANDYDFVFSANNFMPGTNILAPKKISDEWVKLRKFLNLDNKIQFYGLKDTGITDMFNAGIPNIKIRNQARHHDLKMTEIYAQRNQKADEDILNFK
jgi:integrase